MTITELLALIAAKIIPETCDHDTDNIYINIDIVDWDVEAEGERILRDEREVPSEALCDPHRASDLEYDIDAP
jgi:hypothetical protein